VRSERHQDPFSQAGFAELSRDYGASAHTTPAVCDFAGDVAAMVEATIPAELPHKVAGALAGLLREPGLLGSAHRVPSQTSYARHILFADPLRRFTILALIWLPGQSTPVHGHTAWGAMGLYEGTLTSTDYLLSSAGLPVLECHPVRSLPIQPGMTAGVLPGLDDIHRLANESAAPAISIHVYGKDLLLDPGSLNIVLSH